MSRDWVSEVSKELPALKNLIPDSPPRRNTKGELISSSETGSPARASPSDAAPSASTSAQRGTRAHPAMPEPQQQDVEMDPTEPDFAEDADGAEEVMPQDVKAPPPPVKEADVTFAEDSDDAPDFAFAEDSDEDVIAVTNQPPAVPVPPSPVSPATSLARARR